MAGGICNHGKAQIVNTTLADNAATRTGGPGYGGGIENHETASIPITGSTLRGNTAHLRRWNSGVGAVTIDQTTIVSNTSELGGSGIT